MRRRLRVVATSRMLRPTAKNWCLCVPEPRSRRCVVDKLDLWAVPLGSDFVPAGAATQPWTAKTQHRMLRRAFSRRTVLAYLAQRRPGFEADRWEFGCDRDGAVSVADGKRRFDGATNWPLATTVSDFRLSPASRVDGNCCRSTSAASSLVEISPGDASELRLAEFGQSGPALYLFTGRARKRPPEVYRVDLDAMGKAIGTGEP